MLERLRVGGTLLGVLVVLLACKGKGKSTAAPSASDPAPAPPPETPADVVMTKPTLAEAVAYAAKFSDPKRNEHSTTAVLVLSWAQKNMYWDDVVVSEDETTYALAKKDIDVARGKRLCFSGTIVQIMAHKNTLGKTDEGLILSEAGNIFYFATIGSSGDLVAQSYGRICGVIADEYDYSNSIGGTGHALDMVGFFDLPENRTRLRAPPTKPTPTDVATATPQVHGTPPRTTATATTTTTAPTTTSTGNPLPTPTHSAATVAPFDRGAAATAVSAVNVSSCKQPSGPTGSGHVKVTFEPSGSVSKVDVDQPPFAGTAVGTCIEGKFRTAHVPPFAGGSVTIGKAFSVN